MAESPYSLKIDDKKRVDVIRLGLCKDWYFSVNASSNIVFTYSKFGERAISTIFRRKSKENSISNPWIISVFLLSFPPSIEIL